jgi:predicted PilT family ATPase
MFAFGSEIAVVPVDETTSGNKISPITALARDQLVHKIRQWVGVQCGVKITGSNSAEIYAPKGMVSTLIGKGGENIRSLQDELGGIKLSVSPFSEMPDDVQVMSDDPFEKQDRRARETAAWENTGKGGRKSNRKRR